MRAKTKPLLEQAQALLTMYHVCKALKDANRIRGFDYVNGWWRVNTGQAGLPQWRRMGEREARKILGELTKEASDAV